MNQYEKKQILEKSAFFLHKGYVENIEDNIITYFDKDIEFIVTFELSSNASDISIKFKKENLIYSIGWIACVRSNLRINPHEKLNNILNLLEYIKENYNTIISLDYCRESSKLIDDFIAEKRRYL